MNDKYMKGEDTGSGHSYLDHALQMSRTRPQLQALVTAAARKTHFTGCCHGVVLVFTVAERFPCATGVYFAHVFCWAG